MAMVLPLPRETGFFWNKEYFRIQFSELFVFSSWNIRTLCFNALVESTPECSPVKIWSLKLFPGEKDLDFPPPRNILRNLVHPRENVE